MAASRQGKIDACSLRLFSVYGPRERPEKLYPRLIECILHDKEFTLFDGSYDHYRSYTYVADAVVILGSIDKEGKVILVHPSQKSENGLPIA